jgi:hypothetical protein
VRTRALADFPWPETTAYRRVRATTAEVLAVYADFAGQPRWVPDLIAIRVLAREAPNVFRVFYEYEVMGPNERYTVTVTLGRGDGALEGRWRRVEARYARQLAGELSVRPQGRRARSWRTRAESIRVQSASRSTRRTPSRGDSPQPLRRWRAHLRTAEPATLTALVGALETAPKGP